MVLNWRDQIRVWVIARVALRHYPSPSLALPWRPPLPSQSPLCRQVVRPFLLKCLAAFCVLDNVGATSVATSVTSPPSPPPCATPVDFALVLDESYSMNRKEGPDFINGLNGTKAFAKELVRHAALKPRSPPTTAHEPEPEPEPAPEPEPEPIPR